MKKLILGLLVGFVLGGAFLAYAKNESESLDAKSVVGYGKFNGVLVAIQVDADGVLQTS